MVTIGEYLTNPALMLRKARWLMLYHGRPREVTLDTYNGLLTFDSRDRIIGRQLYLRRGFEADWLERSMGYLLGEGLLPGGGGRVLDVGANIGMICIALLQRGIFDGAVAFEPEPRNYELLRRNLEQNALTDRCLALQLALSSTSGELEMELSEYNSGDHRIRSSASDGAFGENRRKTVSVPVVTLDEAVEQTPGEFENVRLIWLDIQGHEGHFLRGARRFLQRRIPVVSEFWPYGILRSGMSRDDYLATIAAHFTHSLVQESTGLRMVETARLADLFDALTGHTDMRQMILLNR